MSKNEETRLAKIEAREERMQKALEERIEKKDRKAVERFLSALAKRDRKEFRRWEKDFARD